MAFASLRAAQGKSTPRGATGAAAAPPIASSSVTSSFVAQSRIRVVVRVRPKLPIERNDSCDFLTINRSRNSLQLSASVAATEAKSFVFDQVFDPLTSQPEVYDQIGFASMLTGVLDGYHTTIFAYGQIIPRVIFNLFEMISAHSLASTTTTGRREFIIKCSFVQIYNEQILDLFNPSHLQTPSSSSGGTRSSTPSSQRTGPSRKAPGKSTGSISSSSCGLKLRWSAAREFYVENLRILECQSPEQVAQHFQEGIKHKVMASHRLNAASSRSHCVFTIYVESFDPSDNPDDVLQSKLALVDLAGSERIDKTGATGATLQESIGINKSLFVLRQVIQALSEESTSNGNGKAAKAKDARDRAYIPYRDSKLTSLLKYSLGGNSFTLMIACLSPSDAHFDENLSTLVYASKAQCIANKPMKNEDPKTIFIHELKQEVEGLRKQLMQAQDIILSFQQLGPSGNLSSEVVGENQVQEECSKCKRVAGNDPSEEEKERSESSSSVPISSSKPTVASPVPAKPESSSLTIRESATTKKLKLNVIDNVEMIKQLYATEKALTDRVRTQSSRIEDLRYETRVLNVENQSLRDKMEVLEYLIADFPQRAAEFGGSGDNNNNEPEEPEEIPGYGTLTTQALTSSSPSLPRVGTNVPPPAERIREVLRGSRKSYWRRQQESDQNGLVSNQSNQNNQRKTEPQPKAKRKDLETGLLSLNELKDLLGGKKQNDQQSSSSTNSNNGTRPGRTISNGRQQQQPSQTIGGGKRSELPAPPPPIKHSASSSDLFAATGAMPSDRSSLRANSAATTSTASSILATLEQNPSQLPRRSAFELDPLDSLSELNRLLQVKATLRRVTARSSVSADTNLFGTK